MMKQYFEYLFGIFYLLWLLTISVVGAAYFICPVIFVFELLVSFGLYEPVVAFATLAIEIVFMLPLQIIIYSKYIRKPFDILMDKLDKVYR